MDTAQGKDGGRARGRTVIYAVGDVHGRADLLADLHRRIAADAAARAPARKVLVHLGDYVDRGPDSRGVIALAMAGLPGFETVSLRGNHEQMMVDWIATADADVGDVWMCNGGRETAQSLLGPDWDGNPDPRTLKAALGREAMAWLTALPFFYREGGFFFVHAGIRPNRPLDAQREEDMLWIRDKFLRDQRDYGARIVHGHTPKEDPVVRPNRIGLDTGAVWTGRLTAAVLDPDEAAADPEFLYAEGNGDLAWKPRWL